MEFELNTSGIKLPDWIVVKELDEPNRKKAHEWENHIDKGESAAIALAMQVQADWLLSDDVKARQFAETIGLEVHGSIGLLLWAITTGYIESKDKALDLINALGGSSLWISDRVLSQARKAIDKIFSS